MTCKCCFEDDHKTERVIAHTANFYSLKDVVSHNQKFKNSKFSGNFHKGKISLKRINKS